MDVKWNGPVLEQDTWCPSAETNGRKDIQSENAGPIKLQGQGDKGGCLNPPLTTVIIGFHMYTYVCVCECERETICASERTQKLRLLLIIQATSCQIHKRVISKPTCSSADASLLTQ